MGRDRQAGPAGGPGGGAMDPLLPRRDPRLVGPDLADDPRPDTAVPHPLGRLADDLVGQLVDRAPIDQRLGRVVRVAVPARAHHDVEPGRFGQADEPGRLASDARQRQIDERRATGLTESKELIEDHRLIPAQLPVVPAVRDVPERDRGVLVGQRPAEVGGVDRATDRLRPAGDHEAASSSRSPRASGGAAARRGGAATADAAMSSSITARTRRSDSARR